MFFSIYPWLRCCEWYPHLSIYGIVDDMPMCVAPIYSNCPRLHDAFGDVGVDLQQFTAAWNGAWHHNRHQPTVQHTLWYINRRLTYLWKITIFEWENSHFNFDSYIKLPEGSYCALLVVSSPWKSHQLEIVMSQLNPLPRVLPHEMCSRYGGFP